MNAAQQQVVSDIAVASKMATSRFAQPAVIGAYILGKIRPLLEIMGGKDALVKAATEAYDRFAAPLDIPGLLPDTEEAIDAANRLVIRDLVNKAADSIAL